MTYYSRFNLWWAPRTAQYCVVRHDVALATTLLPVHLGRTPTLSGLISYSFPFCQIALPWPIFSSVHYGNIFLLRVTAASLSIFIQVLALGYMLCSALRLCIDLDRWIMELRYLAIELQAKVDI